MRLLTESQYLKLRILGDPYVLVLAPGRRDWMPLLRRQLVEPISEDEGKRCLPPLRITSAGLRALADYLDAHPQSNEWAPGAKPRQLDERPAITDLRRRLKEAEAQRDSADRDRYHALARLRVIKREVERIEL